MGKVKMNAAPEKDEIDLAAQEKVREAEYLQS